MDFVSSTSIEMNLWPVEHFCPPFFFQISADLEKNGGQKCSTGQRFIFTEVTFYKIHILINSPKRSPNNYFLYSDKSAQKMSQQRKTAIHNQLNKECSAKQCWIDFYAAGQIKKLADYFSQVFLLRQKM